MIKISLSKEREKYIIVPIHRARVVAQWADKFSKSFNNRKLWEHEILKFKKVLDILVKDIQHKEHARHQWGEKYLS